MLAVRLDRSAIGPNLASCLRLASLVNLKLFNGDCMYGGSRPHNQQFQQLRFLVSRKRKAVEELVNLRGKIRLLPRSDLEIASEDAGLLSG